MIFKCYFFGTILFVNLIELGRIWDISLLPFLRNELRVKACSNVNSTMPF